MPAEHAAASIDADAFVLGPVARRVLAVIRIAVGVMWLSNLGWKRPPNFGALHRFTQAGVDHPVATPYAWLTEHVILPHFAFFGWRLTIRLPP